MMMASELVWGGSQAPTMHHIFVITHKKSIDNVIFFVLTFIFLVYTRFSAKNEDFFTNVPGGKFCEKPAQWNNDFSRSSHKKSVYGNHIPY